MADICCAIKIHYTHNDNNKLQKIAELVAFEMKTLLQQLYYHAAWCLEKAVAFIATAFHLLLG